MTEWRERITVDPSILVGKPVIKGTGISVELMLEQLASGWSMDDILSSYPCISREDALAAISFAADWFREETIVAIARVRAQALGL